VASLAKPDGFFDPDNPSGLPNRQEEQEILEPSDEVDNSEEVVIVSEDATEGLAETPAEEEEEDENSDPRPSLLSFSNTDLLFSGNYLVAGNYHGFNTYDISNPTNPMLLSSVVCPGGQGDVSLIGNLLIMSVQETRGRLDCGLAGVPEPVSGDRIQGIRIFDVSDFSMPLQVGAVQTCRGSHTHTVVGPPDQENIAYVYVSGAETNMLKKLFIILVSGLILTSCTGTTKKSGGAITAGSQEDLIVNVGDRVFFEFDSNELTVDGQSTLDAQAAWLKQYSETDVTIEGHADERGTREYNLALGDKRAFAVYSYLNQAGIDSNRMNYVSFGKERPEVVGSSDSAWSQNRRSVTTITK
jgi:peptidoglycan-associated lipoprotein